MEKSVWSVTSGDVVKDRHNKYYEVLGQCDKAADSGLFIEFLLEAIKDSLNELMSLLDLKRRLTFRKNYLLPAIDAGFIEMTIPDKPNSKK